MPIPTPAGALSVTFQVLCLRCLRAKARSVLAHDCVWSPSSSKCEYCTTQQSTCVPLPWFLDEKYRVLIAAETTIPLVAADFAAAASEANRVALMAAQSVPKFCSVPERDSYEELHATRAAIEAGMGQIRSSLRCLRTEQGSVPALLGEVVAALGRLPAVAVAAMVPDRTGGRRKRGRRRAPLVRVMGRGRMGSRVDGGPVSEGTPA
ncbi:hypothetical protein GMDG_06014 [Pseudogymnoascus destructans 20631-21]|uniref:Uncharacterized protein n=1 Tax=Pseudogymnoascus destructans (strain ATCC MYA-4855 / 20631-21) TaxID=658429 RepID=L8FRS5_PSED2|nr:hypothetical protein GMDG_06014 [Pseudogymnoascus destructans 20631-21]